MGIIPHVWLPIILIHGETKRNRNSGDPSLSFLADPYPVSPSEAGELIHKGVRVGL